MNKSIPLALLVGGIIVIAYGVVASNSFGSNISNTFDSAPTDKTMWLLIIGGALAIVGHAGMIRSSKKPRKVRPAESHRGDPVSGVGP
jgi:hypothetical protein